MASVGHLRFLPFDRIALVFEYTDSIGMVIFTIQGHLEVKTKMVAVAAIFNF